MNNPQQVNISKEITTIYESFVYAYLQFQQKEWSKKPQLKVVTTITTKRK
jgi:hypothetical protein